MKVLDVAGHAANAFYILLMYSGSHTYLPELYDILGHEKMIKVLDVFAGTTIKFPSEKELQRLAAEIRIYFRLKRANKKLRCMLMKEIADELGVTEDEIRAVFNKTSRVLEQQLGLEILDGKKRRRFRATPD